MVTIPLSAVNCPNNYWTRTHRWSSNHPALNNKCPSNSRYGIRKFSIRAWDTCYTALNRDEQWDFAAIF